MKSSDFVYEKKLGAGSFGAVYRVRAKSDNSLYVIKQQIGRSSTDMVENEIKLLKAMRHPNIVAYHGSWHEDRKVYILMEYATRGTLKQLMERYKKPFEEEEALYLFAQIALGVHHIHKQMVLHRDLKPGNVMLHGTRGDIVKIGDFGVSKNIRLESAKTRVGTRFYMAPEILEGRTYDYTCDIWSCGIILYELLTNRFPFNTKNHLEMIEQMSEGRVRALPAEGISPGTKELTYKMMRRDPAKRPLSRQLVLCPVLLSSIAKVYLNVGRIEKAMILGHDTFKHYMAIDDAQQTPLDKSPPATIYHRISSSSFLQEE